MLHTVYYDTITFFQLAKKCILKNIRNALFTGTITLRIVSSFLNYIFGLHCDILLLRHKYVIYLLKAAHFWWRQNYVELWKLLEHVNRVCKLRYKVVIFKFVIYVLAHQLFDNADIFDYVKITFVVVFSIKYRNNFTITLHMCSSKWRIL